MINIRKNIFETNSSSTHAICIAKSNDYHIPSELHFEFGEFGWENRFLSGPTELASYLYTAICEIYYNKPEEIEKFKNEIYELLGKYGCECTFEEPTKSSWGYDSGYVDHAGELVDLIDSLRKSEKKLLRFLFSYDSYIITGNDNDETFSEVIEEQDFSDVDVFYKCN